MPVPEIAVEPVGSLQAAQVNVGPTVAIHVADRHTRSVVGDRVGHVSVSFQDVREGDPCALRVLNAETGFRSGGETDSSAAEPVLFGPSRCYREPVARDQADQHGGVRHERTKHGPSRTGTLAVSTPDRTPDRIWQRRAEADPQPGFAVNRQQCDESGLGRGAGGVSRCAGHAEAILSFPYWWGFSGAMDPSGFCIAGGDAWSVAPAVFAGVVTARASSSSEIWTGPRTSSGALKLSRQVS